MQNLVYVKGGLLIMVLINWVFNIACVNFGMHCKRTTLNIVDTFYMEFDEYQCIDSTVMRIVESMRVDSKSYFGNEINVFYYSYYTRQQKGDYLLNLVSTTCYHVIDTTRSDNVININSGVAEFGNIFLVINAYPCAYSVLPDSSLYYFRKHFRKTGKRIKIQYLKDNNEGGCSGEKLSLSKNYLTRKDNLQLLSIDSSKLSN